MDLFAAREKLILALDVADVPAARSWSGTSTAWSTSSKSAWSCSSLPAQAFLEELLAQGKRVFLDYKYHDIPETVRKAVERASTIGVELLTVHGYTKVMQAAVKGRSGKLKVFAVTVLTSMDRDDIAEMGYPGHSVEDLVLIRARKALEAGCEASSPPGKRLGQLRKRSPTTPGDAGYPARRFGHERPEAGRHPRRCHPSRRGLPGGRPSHHPAGSGQNSSPSGRSDPRRDSIGLAPGVATRRRGARHANLWREFHV